jgi:anti-sigma factor RsiW
MKPCSKNRKPIAWLVSGALDAKKASALRAHFAHCENCRQYFEELSSVTEKLALAALDSTPEPSELFHRRVVEKLRAVESPSFVETLAAWVRGPALSWRVALPALTLLFVGFFAVLALRNTANVKSPAVQMASPQRSADDPAPTLANYQRIANQSFDKLDELLTRQACRPLPPVSVYSASSSELANAPF